MLKTLKALFVLFAFGLVFTACKKDKDDEVSIVGKWEVFQEHGKNYINGTPVDPEEPVNISPNDEDYYVLEFKNDGNFTITYNGENPEHGKYRIDGNKIYFSDPTSTDEDDSDFTISGNELTLISKGEYTVQNNTYKFEYIFKHRRK